MEKNMNILAETLIRGRDSAKRLQNLLRQNGNNDMPVSIDDLVMEIYKSFAKGLLVLDSCGFGEICCHGVGLACSSDQQSVVITCNSEKILTRLAKEGRGHNKGRKIVDSSVKVSDTSEDGYVWRKYGQKEILNSKFPRCYFRCTYKDDHGCIALKQVQQLEGESNKFHIKYFGCHTCPASPQDIISNHHPAGPGVLLNFEGFKNNGYLANNPLTTQNTHINPSKKQKVQSNKVKPRNDARSAPTLVSNDTLLDGFYPCSESPGSDHGDSSLKIVSNGPLETNLFLNEDVLNEILVDDILLTARSLWD